MREIDEKVEGWKEDEERRREREWVSERDDDKRIEGDFGKLRKRE